MLAEGSIAGILKKPGEGVEADEVLFQIETDKVTIDVRAPQSGTLEEVLVCFLMPPCSMRFPSLPLEPRALVSGPMHCMVQAFAPMHEHLSVPPQVKEDETVTVGQVLAKIAAGEAPSQPAGHGSQDSKQEDAAAGAAPADSTAVDTESQKDSGMPMRDPYPR